MKAQEAAVDISLILLSGDLDGWNEIHQIRSVGNAFRAYTLFRGFVFLG
jgi:hypothetical protein